MFPSPGPVILEPILKPKVWGGRALAAFGKQFPEGVMIGESWELADLPPEVAEGGASRVLRGGEQARGRLLRQLIEADPDYWLGDAATDDGRFPLLLKYLDARENLSVQVHPSPAYAAKHPDAFLKHEAWVILHAEPGAVIWKGIVPDVNRSAFVAALEAGRVTDLLMEIPVKAGECHHLPSGTCHALGAGVVVAEVQTPSDTTFRLDDWGRTGRPLHRREGLECLSFPALDPDAMQADPRNEPIKRGEEPGNPEVPGVVRRRLCTGAAFVIEHVEAAAGCPVEERTTGCPVAWMVVKGTGMVQGAGQSPLRLELGDTVLFPARLDATSAVFETDATLLRITVPAREAIQHMRGTS